MPRRRTSRLPQSGVATDTDESHFDSPKSSISARFGKPKKRVESIVVRFAWLVATTMALVLIFGYRMHTPPQSVTRIATENYSRMMLARNNNTNSQQQQQENSRPLIVEALLLNIEVELLAARLNHSYKHVDLFVILESTLTHSGVRKQIIFDTYETWWKPYRDKILYVVEEVPPLTLWQRYFVKTRTFAQQREHDQRIVLRNVLYSSLGGWFLRPYDLVFHTDMDEIVDYEAPDLQPYLLPNNNNNNTLWKNTTVVYMINQLYYYHRECFLGIWHKSFFMPYKEFQKANPEELRRHCDGPNKVRLVTGWHLSNFGGVGRLQQKLQSTSHTHYAEYAHDTDWLRDCIQNCKNFDRDSTKTLVQLPLDQNPYPPPFVWEAA